MVRKAKAIRKETPRGTKAPADPVLMWRGQVVEIVGNEPVTKGDGSVVLCAKIKIVGLPLHRGLRLVPLEELEYPDKPGT